MQGLGLDEAAPKTESRLKALLWPGIQNDIDLDYVTRQGFWVCIVVGVIAIVMDTLSGSPGMGLLEGVFYFTGAMGVRQRKRGAAAAVFLVYLLSVIVSLQYTGRGVGILTIACLALLLANLRGNWVASKWEKETNPDLLPQQLTETFTDRLVDKWPELMWPKVRWLFYPLGALFVTGLMVAALGSKG